MANRFQKFIYYFSSLSPIMMILALLWLVQKSTWSKPVVLNWKIPAILVAVALLLIIVFNIFFNKALNELSIMTISGSGFRCIDGWLVGYVVAYMAPLATLVISNVSKIVLGIILVIIMAVLVFSDYVTPHPLLFLKGYHFYELSVDGMASDYKVISKKQVKTAQDFRKVSRVFEFLLIRIG